MSRLSSHAVQGELKPLANVRNIIAVGSGKGGVGKSTTAVNLALALAAEGAKVGILDADVYGPSVPMMLGLSGRPDSPDGKTITPMQAHGVEAMSIGLLVDQDTPMIWRGPMATQALSQLLNDTRWGDLDVLVVDLPPGTGDIQLTMAQKIPVAGAVIVTTPQDIATLDARKALKMFEKVNIPVLGLIENMAVHVCAQLRPRRAHLRRRRRRADGRAVRGAAAGRAAAGDRHPRAGRCRHPDRGGAAGFRGGAGLPRGCAGAAGRTRQAAEGAHRDHGLAAWRLERAARVDARSAVGLPRAAQPRARERPAMDPPRLP